MGAAANATGPDRLSGPVGRLLFGRQHLDALPAEERESGQSAAALDQGRAAAASTSSRGSFSFINSDEIVAMLKATANNALGFAFQLAIKSISPQIAATIEEMAQKAQQMNQFNMNSCEIAQNLVGGLWGKIRPHVVRDLQVDRQQPGALLRLGEEPPRVRDGRSARVDDRMRTAIRTSPVRELQLHVGNAQAELSELLGRVPRIPDDVRRHGRSIYQDGDASGKRGYQFVRARRSRAADCASRWHELGHDAEVRRHRQVPQSDYRRPMSVSQALRLSSLACGRMIESMNAKVRSNAALTTDEIGLLGATSDPALQDHFGQRGGDAWRHDRQRHERSCRDRGDGPARCARPAILRLCICAASARFQNANEEALVAVARSDRLGAPGPRCLFQGDEPSASIARSTSSSARSSSKGTLRNNLSPQMSAALSFSTSLSKQGIQ